MFVFVVLGVLVFLAWRARKENSAPPVIISDQAVEKLGRMMNPVALQSLAPVISRMGEKQKEKLERDAMFVSDAPMARGRLDARNGRENLASRFARSPSRRFSDDRRLALGRSGNMRTVAELIKALNIKEAEVQRLLDEGLDLTEVPFITEDELRELVETKEAHLKIWTYIKQQTEVGDT